MYLREEDVLHPAEDSWPSITLENITRLSKSDEVSSLLRYLPYLRRLDGGNDLHRAAYYYFVDLQENFHWLERGRLDGDGLRLVSEGAKNYENVPPYVVSLALGGRDNLVFLLDIELASSTGTNAQAPENKADWRGDAARWTVKDFFEILKDQFIALGFIPISPLRVLDVHTGHYPCLDDWMKTVQAIY
ncbi:hypothetical protein LX36DRAFT_711440 [Colletotrichum falcatum]|nr:hypothetical protein LX36DRAFT_711440 [Colletotrichum falcatum]